MSTTPEETADALSQPYVAKTYEWGQGDQKLKVTLRPLSWYGQLELIGLLGKSLDRAIEHGVKLEDIVGPVQGWMEEDESKRPSQEELAREATLFITSLGRLLADAPELGEEFYPIVFSIPRGDREFFNLIVSQSPDTGGMSGEQGIEIAKGFYEQNRELVQDFFDKRIKPFMEKAQPKIAARTKRKPASSASSRRSAQSTPKE